MGLTSLIVNSKVKNLNSKAQTTESKKLDSLAKSIDLRCPIHSREYKSRVAIVDVFKTRLLMKPLITLFLPLCNLPTFKLPVVNSIQRRRAVASHRSGLGRAVFEATDPCRWLRLGRAGN